MHHVIAPCKDQLFEHASAAASQPLAVLPHESVLGHDRWLLKLHGCISRPTDVVLTRESYLRYGSTRGALAGLTGSMLLTKRML